MYNSFYEKYIGRILYEYNNREDIEMNYVVKVNWDDEASVWYAICTTIPFAIENDSFDRLIERIKTVALEILEINNRSCTNCTLVIQAEYIKRLSI